MGKDFKVQNDSDWIKIQQTLFGETIPQHAEWTEPAKIVEVLNIVGRVEASNHMMIPNGGGMDLEGAKLLNKAGEVEMFAGMPYIIKPVKLSFESFGDDLSWNYFWLETGGLEPTGVYKNLNPEELEEELLELSPGKYIHRKFWDEGEYQDEPLPDSARVVFRFFKGAFLIVQKLSPYNMDNATYDGRHEKVGEAAFRQYVQKQYSRLVAEK